jgi:hypothetical protein
MKMIITKTIGTNQRPHTPHHPGVVFQWLIAVVSLWFLEDVAGQKAPDHQGNLAPNHGPNQPDVYATTRHLAGNVASTSIASSFGVKKYRG